MAFHIKSTTKFKALIGFSALAVSGVAALFSVTGVSTLFKGAWLAIVLMMGILEFAKIVVASYIARFWKDISKTLRVYFTIAIIVLMIITSAGIFGYLSEAYQGTKGNYDVTEQESGALSAKAKNYNEQMQRYKDRVNTLNSFRASQEVRLDSLYSRGQNASAKRVEQGIQRNDAEVQSLNDKISSLTDSVGSINNQIITKQSVNIKGELGPLKFIATAFGTDMDTIVKYLIMMLIFVFDPLAVLLFVSLSVMIRKEAEIEKVITNNSIVVAETPKINVDMEVKPSISLEKVETALEKMNIVETKEEETPEEKELQEVVETLSSNTPTELPVVVEPEPIIEEPPLVIEDTEVEKKKEPDDIHELKEAHEFYYGEEQKKDEPTIEPPPVSEPPTVPAPPPAPPVTEWKTANWRGR